MHKDYYFKVADYTFKISLPVELAVDAVLPSFNGFSVEASADIDFSVEVQCGNISNREGYKLIDESINDMGHIRLLTDGIDYRFEVIDEMQVVQHTMICDQRFCNAKINLNPGDILVDQVLTSLVRMHYSQAIALRGGISIHASAVLLHGKAYLFLGKSGTGKSTHAKLWMKEYSEAILLNDDNPTLRILDGKLIAYGTPWSGKTPCYKNLSAEVGGVARLCQAKINNFERAFDVDAFIAMLPGCSFIISDIELRNSLYNTLSAMVQLAKVGILKCLPDVSAAKLCYTKLMK